jgi:uncharacterized protein YutE (UPF0331/DUF86 family)
MTDDALDAPVVYERLRVIRELLDDLDAIGDLSATDLTTNRVHRHAVERIITQVVDLAVAINSHIAAVEVGRGPATYRSSFADAAQAGALPADLADRLAPGAGLRNILTHEYVAIDLERVAAAIPIVRTGFREYLAAIARFVARQGTEPAVPGESTEG